MDYGKEPNNIGDSEYNIISHTGSVWNCTRTDVINCLQLVKFLK